MSKNSYIYVTKIYHKIKDKGYTKSVCIII